MTFTLTSLCEVKDDKNNTLSFHGSLLKFENVTILLDPGWFYTNSKNQVNTEEFEDSATISNKLIEFWEPIISDVNIILISQSSIDCLGSYAFLFTLFTSIFYNNQILVYSTLPIISLGRVSTIELYTDCKLIGPFIESQLDLEDIEIAFDYIRSVKYSQTIDLKSITFTDVATNTENNDKFDGLSFVGFNSGHSIGGVIWCVSYFQEEKLIYCPRWNHTRDTLINGSQMIDTGTSKPITALQRPSGIIASTKYTVSSQNSLSWRRKLDLFKKILQEFLNSSNSNTILIPTTIGGRFLDLVACVMDFIYENKTLNRKMATAPPIYLLCYSKGRSLTYAKSMLEWLSNSIVKTWQSRDNKTPFDLNIKIVTPEELKQNKNRNKMSMVNGGIYFISDSELLFNQALLSVTGKYSILLTDQFIQTPVLKDMITYKLSSNTYNNGKPSHYSKDIFLKISKQTNLDDQNLVKYKDIIKERELKRTTLQYEWENIQQENKKRSLNGLIMDDSSDEDDDDQNVEDNNQNGKLGNGEVYNSEKQLLNFKVPMDTIITANMTIKQQTFPYKQPKSLTKKDEYGEIVDFSQFIPIEEEDDIYIPELQKRLNSGSDSDGDDDDDDNYDDDDGNKEEQEEEEEEEEDGDDYDPAMVTKLTKKVALKKKNKNKNRNNKGKKDNIKRRQSVEQREKILFDDISYLNPLGSMPTKSEIEVKKFKIDCNLAFIDMSSFVDQRSMEIILPLLKPKKMIFIESEKAFNVKGIMGTSKLVPSSASTSFSTNNGVEIVYLNDQKEHEFATSFKSLDIFISPELEKTLHWQKILNGKYRITDVQGKLVKSEEDNTRHRFKFVLQPLHDNMDIDSKYSTAQHYNNNIHIGDVKLTDLRRILNARNYKTEFKGDGTLVVNDKVAIKKISDSETIVDGKPDKLFYEIKKIVKNMLATF
ncbi:uncharacterized protein SCODWIG_03428 [Saccharomycodes ludwigii]|uniref:Cleavage and polyadenylation specificity factor subunit 2 n=1 Tax=Saccharomycodes ludwigii TaxID=36035 RepID=A0A376BAK9_9ASCO|nr:hypothetical protein SCDLUD_001743 [Saccharomycodes ludwigii]KAH3901957.1 hypothetical protein SCDLUD_001743 [Saccharomycodes ludwigii]SSD61667.1 uncharacterized protein SCODWIG_03428 [Saccharomycodes ludwigii]